MPDNIGDQVLFKLADLRESIRKFMKPQVLNKLGDLLELLGPDNKSHVKQYKFWVNKNGPDCNYASFAKQFFLDDHADDVAQCIIWLHDNWARLYRKKGK